MAAAYLVMKHGHVVKVETTGRTNPETRKSMPNGPGNSSGIQGGRR